MTFNPKNSDNHAQQDARTGIVNPPLQTGDGSPASLLHQEFDSLLELLIFSFADALWIVLHLHIGFDLRLFHEMNGTWYPWGINVNGNTPARLPIWRAKSIVSIPPTNIG